MHDAPGILGVIAAIQAVYKGIEHICIGDQRKIVKRIGETQALELLAALTNAHRLRIDQQAFFTAIAAPVLDLRAQALAKIEQQLSPATPAPSQEDQSSPKADPTPRVSPRAKPAARTQLIQEKAFAVAGTKEFNALSSEDQKTTIMDIAEQYPASVFEEIDTILKLDFAKEILLFVTEKCAWQTIFNAPKFIEESFAEEVIRVAAKQDPESATMFFPRYQGLANAADILTEAKS